MHTRVSVAQMGEEEGWVKKELYDAGAHCGVLCGTEHSSESRRQRYGSCSERWLVDIQSWRLVRVLQRLDYILYIHSSPVIWGPMGWTL
jgi:hypothetical protein